MPARPDIYALGDVHGDYDRMVQVLVAAKLIAPKPAKPQAVQWTGGKAVLVQTGDMIDKYTQSMQVIALLRALQPSADDAGGRVIVTMGNHEAEFLAANGADTKGAEFSKELTTAGLSPSDVVKGRDGQGIGAWMRDLPFGAKVGEWFFCHAGNTGSRTLADLQTQLEAEVTEKGFKAPILLDPNSMLEARMHPLAWWETAANQTQAKQLEQQETKDQRMAESGGGKKAKGTAQAAAADEKNVKQQIKQLDKEIEDALRNEITPLGAKHLIFAHQPDRVVFVDKTFRPPGAMYARYNGLVFLIDTGMSRGVNSGRGAVLHITPGGHPTVVAIYADGEKTGLMK
jgi:hypothetical protein